MLPLTAGRCIIDLNYLFHRHQLSLVASTDASSSEARVAHRGLTVGYATRIARLRAASGGSAMSAARVS